MQVAPPHAPKRTAPPVAENTTADPASGVAPSPEITFTANAGDKITPVVTVPLGALTRRIDAWAAVHEALATPLVIVAVTVIGPAVVGVTEVDAMPDASVVTAQVEAPQTPRMTPFDPEKATGSPCTGVVPSPASTRTENAAGVEAPTVVMPLGALTTRTLFAAATTCAEIELPLLDATSIIAPATFGVTTARAVPFASVVTVQVADPHEPNSTPDPVDVNATAAPTLGVTPSAALMLMANGTVAAVPTVSVPVGALTSRIRSGCTAAAVNDPVTDP